MSIEELLREAATKGLTHFSLHPTESTDGKTVYWRASATPSTAHRYVEAVGTDIVDVVIRALVQLPAAKKRAAPKSRFDEANPPLSEMAQRAVTVAVTSGDPVDLHDGPNDEWNRFKT